LLPNILGHRDHDVDLAIRNQLNSGILFSLSTPLESQLAETLKRLIPCAEQIRFCKNGSDATTAAVRLARAITGRSHILTTGYHGWHDWTLATTPPHLGVPDEVVKLTSKLNYGDIETAQNILKSKQAACIIVEPTHDSLYLQSLRNLCSFYGSLLIFDEIITGFRWHLGGAQTLFNVTPDLATFGKAMANGMPLAALVGRHHLMQNLNEVFFSGTYFGETLSLAAAIACINKIESHKVVDSLIAKGAQLKKDLESLLESCPESGLKLEGHPSCLKLICPNLKYKTYITQLLINHGILINGSHNLCYAHSESDLKRVTNAYASALPLMKEWVKNGAKMSLEDVVQPPLVRWYGNKEDA
jgi:glutamate-1-semialdehyde 2,1-aminomutase